jgi:hypothetical protein
MIEKIISGGQTGVDRAALDVSIDLNICHGGWCPKGRIDETGIIPIKYERLIEISGDFINDKENYNARTKLNILHSDGTLIIVPSLPIPSYIQDGTVLTIKEVKNKEKPFIIIGLNGITEDNISNCMEWVYENNIKELNFAGPRESVCPGIYDATFSFLMTLIPNLQNSHSLSI